MDRELRKKMAELGYPLFEKAERDDAGKVLYEIAKSDESRVQEGFPVVLANAAEGGKFNYRRTAGLCRNKKEKNLLLDFIVASVAIYRYFHLDYSWVQRLFEELPGGKKKKVDSCYERIKANDDIVIANKNMSSKRLKTIFKNYFREDRVESKGYIKKQEEMSLEFSLSQIFSPKQKNLFFKKLRGEKMNKTEREYYYRTVKKKIIALSNSELHKLARRILESSA